MKSEYENEFDTLVNQYNEWLASVNNPKTPKKNKIKHLLQGIAKIGLYGEKISTNQSKKNPIYRRTNLTPAQKDAIALGSDCQRAYNTLDNIMLETNVKDKTSLKNIIKEKEFIKNRYEHLKTTYITEKMR